MDNFDMTGGNLGGTGDLQIGTAMIWSGGGVSAGGKLTIGLSAALTINGTVGMLGRTIENYGQTIWAAGNITAIDGSFVNKPGAFFDITNSTGEVVMDQWDMHFVFTNDGTLTKSGAGIANLVVDFSNNNATDVQAGTLMLSVAGGGPGGFNVAAPATLSFAANYGVGGTFTSAGALAVQPQVIVDLNGSGNVSGSATLGQDAELSVGTSGFGFSNLSLSGPGLVRVAALMTLALTSAVTVENVGLRGPGEFQVNNTGDLTVVGQVTNDNLRINTGATVDGAGQLIVNGTLTWAGGTMQGTGSTVVNGTTAITGATMKTLDGRALYLAGSTLYNQGLFVVLPTSSILNTGEFTIQGNSLALDNSNVGVILQDPQPTFLNWGTFQKTMAAAGDQSNVGLEFTNRGQVIAATGILCFKLSFVQDNLVIPESVMKATAATAQIIGGNMDIQEGSFEGSGMLAIKPSFVGQGATLNWKKADFTGDGKLQIASGALMNILGDATISNKDFILENDGTIEWQDGKIDTEGTITNKAGRLFSINFAANVDAKLATTQDGKFNNSGTVSKLQANEAEFDLPFQNLAGATLTVSNGTLVLVQDGGFAASTVQVNGAASTLFLVGESAITGSLTFAGNGTVRVANGGTLTIEANNSLMISTAFELGVGGAGGTRGNLVGPGNLGTQGFFSWADGSITNIPSFDNNGVISITQGGVFPPALNDCSLNNNGIIRIQIGTWSLTNGSIVNNNLGGEIRVTEGTAIRGDLTGPQIVNGALLSWIAAGGNNFATVAVHVENCATGVITVEGGQLSLSDLNNLGLIWASGGRVEILGDNFTSYGNIVCRGGIIEVPSGLTIGPAGSFTGFGTIQGDVVNKGVFEVGPADPNDGVGLRLGTVVVNGNFEQTATGTLTIKLLRTATTVESGLLSLGNNLLTLDGTLNVEALFGTVWVPQENDIFTVFEYCAKANDFAATILPSLGGGGTLTWERADDFLKVVRV